MSETVFFLGFPDPDFTETVTLQVPLPTIVSPLPFDLQTFADFAGTETDTSPPVGRLTLPVFATSVADQVAPTTGCGVAEATTTLSSIVFGVTAGGRGGLSNFASVPPTLCTVLPPVADVDGVVVVLGAAVTGRVVTGGAIAVVVGANEDVVVVFPTMATARAVVDGASVIDCGAIVVVVAGLVVEVVVVDVDVGGTPTVTEKFAN